MIWILDYIQAMVPYIVGAFPLILAFRFFRVRNLRKGGIRTTIYHETGVIVLLLYLAGLVSQAIIPNSKSIGFFTGSVNLIPFQVLVTVWREAALNHNFEPMIISLAGNIGIFIPLGLFVPMLWQRTLKQTVLTAFLVSLSIELCQLSQARCSDIDDLGMNTLGGLIGGGVYWLLQRFIPEILGRFKVKKNFAPP